MKYKTFRALVLTGAALLTGLGVWQCNRAAQEREAAEDAAFKASQAEWVAARRAAADQAPGSSPPATVEGAKREVPGLAGDVGGQTPEAYLLATLGDPASEEKLKDVTGGRGSKINVYNEGGKWARAKVDHDRDEKWDEKWSLEGGTIVRQIAPNDDEDYSRELLRQGDGWLEPGAAPVPDAANAAANVAPASSGRPVDDAVLRALQGPAQEKIKDATGGTPYKVNLYSDDRLRWNRVKIDLDRDEKWDEKWTITADGTIEREVAPADDELYSESYLRSGDAWVRR